MSLMKLTFLDMGLAIDTYVNSRERTIREQQEAMQELPTPVLPFREGMLLVPIIGLIDSQRARALTEQLLNAVRDNRAKVVVMDITGVQAVDSKVGNHLVQTVEAARLMGATVILAGVSPGIAQTMVTLGIELGRMTTVGDLQSGIERGEELLGYTVTRTRARSHSA
jgi:rsbT co-antagonist protein RsbR